MKKRIPIKSFNLWTCFQYQNFLNEQDILSLKFLKFPAQTNFLMNENFELPYQLVELYSSY